MIYLFSTYKPESCVRSWQPDFSNGVRHSHLTAVGSPTPRMNPASSKSMCSRGRPPAANGRSQRRRAETKSRSGQEMVGNYSTETAVAGWPCPSPRCPYFLPALLVSYFRVTISTCPAWNTTLRQMEGVFLSYSR